MIKVIKIGGSIQKDEKDYELIADKISKYSDENRTLIVTSAIKGVTDQLTSVINETDKAVDKVTEIYDKHIKLLSKLVDGIEFEKAFRDISRLVDELYRIAWSIRVLDEATPRVKDYILSFGERLAVILLSSFLRTRKFSVNNLIEPPIVTDENYSEANVLLEDSKELLSKKLEESQQKIVVLPGFIGKSKNNRYTTIGRGGSDYTATLIGKLVDAKEVRLVTEVPGIMTADPRKISNSVTIQRLSLEEAIELSQLGAKKLHPRTFDPLFDANMKVIIEGLYEEGCTIIEGLCTSKDGLKGITTKEGLSLITIESTRIVGKIGSASTITSEAKNANVNIIALSQPASETTIQFVVDQKDQKKFVERLSQLSGLIKNIELSEVGAVSIVGCGLRNKEISSKVLSKASSYNPIFVSRGLKGVSITFIVDKKELDSISKELHEVVVNWSIN
ncbi:aspartate kinase [Sulfolobus acidocaldarius]|uniref:Aspartokinase n=4 Tax=Sulfolobus acidocaldarius TaxID=2285 RepID=Q4J8Y8_SULAC|nr:aspartate kinase [Sulfolobus acidocaldarius]AAY80742.1 aspartokinase [Sulfolobus acidocaldarius DSM 639]AGE71339.1 aspartate kinase [Sulfolobus acidocaldarius N8]AGE73608.1 aspartate kinase [Sulfolobus acidocaldarius Ron12/I]ALU30409.1 aspartate kinase [Sulfolobus acidocaldarius]ALU31130.1 aspartate kinase [Sulfolobus acidocaldarius]